ncbi:heme o synthase [Luteolibacter ambystomatis]|uniref:Protoheme IX farnesyltransferase n=1 Tax=Luteolibacter ambystomatis TaxID=2824561 RepID=A0A975J117_9BACT|nr:heme o synthase [Luteolibacter ambystomatis]QUE52063.1 heme o synthase [Luteolibacter ambystomatis]
MAEETPVPPAEEPHEPLLPVPGLRQDLAVLMKVRLNVFVLITAFFGYLLASRGHAFDWMRMLNTLLGTAAAAFGSAAFNQLMEIDLDKRMRRTANRPLPADRMDPMVAFGVGWVLSAFGILHLATLVNGLAATLTAATIAIYVFVYTPLKRLSSTNTLVGAIPGAIPPVIGWVGAGGALDWRAAFLFALLFLWQLPHFVAINWICREEYEQAGYKMWSNGDVSGKKSALLSTIFALMLAAISLMPWVMGFAGWLWGVFGPLLALLMAGLAWRFRAAGDRASARKLFFFTLIYLPAALGLLAIAWR